MANSVDTQNSDTENDYVHNAFNMKLRVIMKLEESFIHGVTWQHCQVGSLAVSINSSKQGHQVVHYWAISAKDIRRIFEDIW